jgi:RNA polymerase sigma-70 factor (ECF subfamily)
MPETATMDQQELDWLDRCARGDGTACAELVARYGRMVGTIILRTLGRREEVEDLAQETFLRVFRYLPEFEGRARFSTWLCTVAQRVAVDHLRRQQRTIATAPEEEGAHVPAADNVARAAQQDERDALVRAALAELPEKFRLPLVYASIEGLDYDTIAGMLGLPIGTVKTHVFRGKQLLRERLAALAPEGADDEY